MAKGLTYADAAVLLGGGPRNPILIALDRLAGGVLLIASATGAPLPLSLFDAKAEFFRLSEELLQSVTGRLRRAKRVERSEHLAAANSVLVIAAYFEAMREVALPIDIDRLAITAQEQVNLAGGRHTGELAAALLRSSAPIPQPEQPYEDSLAELSRFYDSLGQAVIRFLSGLDVWLRLPGVIRSETERTIKIKVTSRAVRTYERLFRRLAVEFPEVAFWANLVDHQATRIQLRELKVALGGLAETLGNIASGGPPNEIRTRLAMSYRAVLRRPTLTSREVPHGLSVPAVEESYINPDFRVAVEVSAEKLADQSWWEDEHLRRPDLQNFLTGYLTSPAATHAPLLVMGQPGAGKSLLTQVLAARLPATDFLVIRIVLRDLDADADLQTHIEEAVRSTIGDSLAWSQLAKIAGDAIPVLLIDGFDELLQATGLSQSNYLEKVAEFQLREADQKRPVVAVVTTRMSMAHRARLTDGTVVVLLEPFDDDQVTHWLAVWREKNERILAKRRLRPLPAKAALAHGELARQPLLLLLLALYDAEGNPLQHDSLHFGEAELYERLLSTFARREVLKLGTGLNELQVARAIDHELRTLSIVAFAMFNRQQLWVSEHDLDADLTELAGPIAGVQNAPEAALSAAQVLVGRFYFVHVAQAIRGQSLLRTIEFLHGTFGEYLIARLIVDELAGDNEDTFSHALLSFAPLTAQPNTISFTQSIIKGLPSQTQKDLSIEVLHRFQVSLSIREQMIENYKPVVTSAPSRYAAYSANMLILTLLTHNEVTAEDLFPGKSSVDEWIKIARLWQSQLPSEGWTNLVQHVTVSREWNSQNRRVRISYGGSATPFPDLYWTYDFPPESHYRLRDGRFSWITRNPDMMRAEAAFLCAIAEDTYVHALVPLLGLLGRTITTFHDFRKTGPVSAAQALISLWMASTSGTNPDELVDIAETCLLIAIHGFAPADYDTRYHFRLLAFSLFVANSDNLPHDWLNGIEERAQTEPGLSKDDRDELVEVAQRVITKSSRP